MQQGGPLKASLEERKGGWISEQKDEVMERADRVKHSCRVIEKEKNQSCRE